VFIREDARTVGRFNEEFELSFPLLPDPDGQVAARYRVTRHPHAVIIDRRGLIVGRVEGERAWAGPLAREWIARLLAGSS